MTQHIVQQGETVGSICSLYELSRYDFFRHNDLTDRMVFAEEATLTAALEEGEVIEIRRSSMVFALTVAQQRDLASGKIRFQGAQQDLALIELTLQQLGVDHPIVGSMQAAAEKGLSASDFFSGLSPAALAAAATACAVAGGLLGKIPKYGTFLGPFFSGVCVLVNRYLAKKAEERKDPPPGSPPPPECPAGQVYSDDYAACGDPAVMSPCADGNGFVSIEGVCIRCPEGQRYDESARSCVDGCPGDRYHFPGIGCVVREFGARCTENVLGGGNKGVIDSEGACTLDGCPEGQIFDFSTMTCVEEAKDNKPSTPTSTEEEPKKSSAPWILLGVAAIAGAAFLVTDDS